MTDMTPIEPAPLRPVDDDGYIRTCPTCGRKAEGEPYDIGSGPEFSCAGCEWCWGATGQALDADDPRKVTREMWDKLPAWARGSMILVDDKGEPVTPERALDE